MEIYIFCVGMAIPVLAAIIVTVSIFDGLTVSFNRKSRSPNLKNKKLPTETVRDGAAQAKYAPYRDRFLVKYRSGKKMPANISRELIERVRGFLPVTAPDISLTSYLNNIISEHMESHWDEICELYNSESEKPL